MGSVIKGTDRIQTSAGAAFNFEDIAKQADGYLAKIREQAKQILAKAAQEANALRAKAEQEGKKAAVTAAEKKTEQHVAAQLQDALAALAQAAQEIRAARQAWQAHWENQAVALAAAIASRILRRELAAAPEVTLHWVREALDLAAGQSRVRLIMNDKDHAALGTQAQQIIAKCQNLGQVEIVSDAHLTRGGCRVETEFGAIDQTIEAQLARIESELSDK